MSWADVQWGTVGEWVAGVGAALAVAAAFVIQRIDHRREDAREQQRRWDDVERRHREALRRVEEGVRFWLSVSYYGGEHVAYVSYKNAGPQPFPSATVRILCGDDVAYEGEHFMEVTYDSPKQYRIEPFPTHVNESNAQLEVTFHDYDGFVFRYHPDRHVSMDGLAFDPTALDEPRYRRRTTRADRA